MKNTVKILLVVLTAGCLASCVGDWETMEAPEASQQVTLDSLFSNGTDADRVLTSAYAQLWYGLPWTNYHERARHMNCGVMETLGDNYESYISYDKVNRAYYTGNMDAGKEDQDSKYWYGTASTNNPMSAEGQWVGIRRAYIFLENADHVPDWDEATKARKKGEAKMVIACLHADMFRHFGGLCCVDRTYSPIEEFKVERRSVKETVKFITGLCDDALNVLPWQLTDNISTNDGRFTGAAALGLKIRVLLFAASPLFNSGEPYRPGSEGYESVQNHQVWTGGYDPAMWQDVVDAGKQFFDSVAVYGVPVLTTGSDYLGTFRKTYFSRQGNGGEALISTRVITSASLEGGSFPWYYYFNNALNQGMANATLEYADMFPMADGTPFDASVWDSYEEGKPLLPDPFVGRDPRLYETCVVNGMAYRSRTAQCYIGGSERGNHVMGYLDGESESVGTNNGAPNFCSGIGDFKFNLGSTLNGLIGQTNLHWPYLRLAEIYLSYAEALNEVGRTSEAFGYVNEVRARVGLNGLDIAVPAAADKAHFREEVLRERACEFGLEEVRFYDLIRWKREPDFRKRLHGLLIRQIKNEYNQTTGYSYEKVALKKRYIQDADGDPTTDGDRTFDPKWYLS
ncbi:MAG: RagB/SusD family nutrient uptake outer membrane protein, partial [Bacteroidales bacterium]|nr:RagB/SusD family nutrient uptake outer membrane protein [Bacteroidales bacterium]